MIEIVNAFCKKNIESWFIKKSRAMYTLYLLNNILAKLPLNSIQVLVEIMLSMMSAKSSPDLRELSWVVIEQLFTKRHIQSDYTKQLLNKILALSSSQIFSATGEKSVMALV